MLFFQNVRKLLCHFSRIVFLNVWIERGYFLIVALTQSGLILRNGLVSFFSFWSGYFNLWNVRSRWWLRIIFVLEKLQDHCHDFLKHLFFFFRFKQLVKQMLVNSFLFLLLSIEISQFVFESSKSIHHYLKGFAKLGCLVAHFLNSVFSRVTNYRKRFVFICVFFHIWIKFEIWRLLGVLVTRARLVVRQLFALVLVHFKAVSFLADFRRSVLFFFHFERECIGDLAAVSRDFEFWALFFVIKLLTIDLHSIYLLISISFYAIGILIVVIAISLNLYATE